MTHRALSCPERHGSGNRPSVPPRPRRAPGAYPPDEEVPMRTHALLALLRRLLGRRTVPVNPTTAEMLRHQAVSPRERRMPVPFVACRPEVN